MLYYLFEYLQGIYDFPGAGLFQYISFRSSMAAITSLLVSLVFGDMNSCNCNIPDDLFWMQILRLSG